MNYLYIGLLIVPLIVLLHRRFEYGLFFSGFLLVALTTYLSIKTPGNLPNLTIHRLILICLVAVWLIEKRKRGFILERKTLIAPLAAVAIVNFISMALSIDVMFSFKTYLSFTLEMFLFFVVMSAGLKQAETGLTLVKFMYAGLLLAAVIGIIEKKTGFNPVDAFLPGYVRRDIMVMDVLSTFPHRILFGTGMAMAIPLALGLSSIESAPWKRNLYLVSLPLVILACYFSDSRGPWAAAAVAVGSMLLFGSVAMKRKIVLCLVAGICALGLKAGVRDTLNAKLQETRDKDSFKGQTYQYRWDLWRVAFNGIKRSLKTMAVGTGVGTGEIKVYTAVLAGSNEVIMVESWDNEFAATLLETGFLGLAMVLVLHFRIIVNLIRAWTVAAPDNRNLLAGIVGAILAQIFMMTNVKMFSAQVNYLMWALVASGLAIGFGARTPAAAVSVRR